MIELKYKFKDKTLLETALTQSGANAAHNNERLEFVGDRVLGLTVAEMLYKMYPSEAEGELARRHAMLVSTETLARVANEMADHLPIVRELIDIEKFKDFRIKFDTITWSNGLDLAPEFIKGLIKKGKTRLK